MMALPLCTVGLTAAAFEASSLRLLLFLDCLRGMASTQSGADCSCMYT